MKNLLLMAILALVIVSTNANALVKYQKTQKSIGKFNDNTVYCLSVGSGYKAVGPKAVQIANEAKNGNCKSEKFLTELVHVTGSVEYVRLNKKSLGDKAYNKILIDYLKQ